MNVGEFENHVSGSPSNLPGHEIFPESVVPLILGMVVFRREGSMNMTCSFMETQGIEHDRGRVDFYNEAEGSIPAKIEKHDALDLIKEPKSYIHVKAPYNSQNLDQFSVDDEENRLWLAMFVVAALVLIILLMLRALKAPKMFLSESYCSNTSQNKFNNLGDNNFTKLTKKQKSIACYFGEINKTTKESTESPRFGSFIDYVEILGSSEVFYTLP